MLESESDFILRSGNSSYQSTLRRRLGQIKEEQRCNVKMREASLSRFNKHFLRYKEIPPSTGSDANDVRMFVTHNPGFCYSRYGKMRSTEFLPEPPQMHSFRTIRDMVFTDGEVDVDKVVCLHLLAPQLINHALLDKRINCPSSSAADSIRAEEETTVDPEAATLEPHEAPTLEPHEEPTPQSHEAPTQQPHEAPTPQPHEDPIAQPHEEPTPKPHEEPTPQLHEAPTPQPHEEPTPLPHEEPTPQPHEEPIPESHEVPHSLTEYDLVNNTRNTPTVLVFPRNNGEQRQVREQVGSNVDKREQAGSNVDKREQAGSNVDKREQAGSNGDKREQAGSNVDKREQAGSNGDKRGQTGSLLPSYLIVTEDASRHLASISKGKNNILVLMHVNTQVELLVDAILDVLQEIKSEKLNEIRQLLGSPQAVAAMLVRPETHQYIDSLASNAIISSSSSYEVCPIRLVLHNEESLFKLPEQREISRTVNLLRNSDATLVLSTLIAEIKHSFVRDNLGENYSLPKKKISLIRSNSINPTCSQDSELSNMAGESTGIKTKKPTTVKPVTDKPSMYSTERKLKNTLNSKPDVTKSFKKVYSKYAKGSGQSLRTLRRVHLSSNIDSTFSANDSNFTITSYSGYTKLKVLSSDGQLSSPTADNKEIEETEMEVRHINLDQQHYVNNRSTSRRATPRKSKIQPIVNKPRKQVKRSLRYTPTMEEAAKHLQQFKERLLNDDFLQKRGYNVDMFGTAFVPEMQEKHQTLPSTLPQFFQQLRRGRNSVNESIDYLQKKFLNAMTPLQRMFVCRKLALLKDAENHTKKHESIPFVSYVIPVLSKQSIVSIVNKFKETERKVLFDPENEGGLGLPLCYMNNSKTWATPAVDNAYATHRHLKSKILSDAKLTTLDLAKLKCEIGEIEIHKKFIKFMSKTILK